jgi:hypothetical protein
MRTTRTSNTWMVRPASDMRGHLWRRSAPEISPARESVSVCQGVRADLKVHDERLASLSSFHEPGRPIAARYP